MVQLQSKGWQAGDPRRASVSVWVRRQEKADAPAGRLSGREREFFLTQTFFFLFRPSTDWTRPAHIGESNLLHFIYWFKCSSHPKTPRITFDQISGPLSARRVAHTIHHHSTHVYISISRLRTSLLFLIFWVNGLGHTGVLGWIRGVEMFINSELEPSSELWGCWEDI